MMTLVNTQCDAEKTEFYWTLLVKNVQSILHPFKFPVKLIVHWALNSGVKGLLEATTCRLAGIAFRNSKQPFLLLRMI
jgi:hypothetical protein